MFIVRLFGIYNPSSFLDRQFSGLKTKINHISFAPVKRKPQSKISSTTLCLVVNLQAINNGIQYIKKSELMPASGEKKTVLVKSEGF